MKRKVLGEEELKDIMLPSEGQVLGVVVKMLGFDRLAVKCDDGKEWQCRISGKLKRRVWMREGDVVLVSPWEFQSDSKGDRWRYTRN